MPQGRAEEELLVADMIELARQYGRYGYRRIAALLRDAGWHVNDKRVERLWRREGLKVPTKQPKKGRVWLNDGSCVRLRPKHRDHVWSYDFVHCRTDDGKAFRTLNIIDEYSSTNFFGKSNDDEEFEDLEDYERDLESILDEAVASGLPTLQLNWHYRSRHESLIAFSNRHYYNDELVTFPSPETTDSAVQLKHLPNASYDRGKTRTNQIEANAIVEDAVLRMKEWLSEPEEQRKTIGVVTFNSQQQSLILDLFDKALQDNPELEWYFSDDRVEPTVVKNLENVQGDERDVMLFSVTFGPDQSGKVPLTFGALNQDGGERRLNVAVTRAREQLVAYTSFLPDQLEAERSKSRGLRDLKRFLEYAHQGHMASETSTQNDIEPDTSAAHQSSLEDEISRRLKLNGWDVQRNVGVSGFRIALAVRHPSDPKGSWPASNAMVSFIGTRRRRVTETSLANWY